MPHMINGGCFPGYILVRMDDNSWKGYYQLQAGDRVHGGATIRAVVEFVDVATITTVEGIDTTPWHPYIKPSTGAWAFPAHNIRAGTATVRSRLVYTLVMDQGHTVQLRNPRLSDTQVVTVCTLGHGIQGDVIGHEFYGTQRVTDDLSRFPGWASGRVRLTRDNQVVSLDGTVGGFVVN